MNEELNNIELVLLRYSRKKLTESELELLECSEQLLKAWQTLKKNKDYYYDATIRLNGLLAQKEKTKRTGKQITPTLRQYDSAEERELDISLQSKS